MDEKLVRMNSFLYSLQACFEENHDYYFGTAVFTHLGTESWKIKLATGLENATSYLSWEKPLIRINGLDLQVYKREKTM